MNFPVAWTLLLLTENLHVPIRTFLQVSGWRVCQVFPSSKPKHLQQKQRRTVIIDQINCFHSKVKKDFSIKKKKKIYL